MAAEETNSAEAHAIQPTAGETEFVISRVFDAPRDLVWKAWTDRERLGRSLEPKAFDQLAEHLARA